MKQLIAPIAIIVALIAFFVIVDRKEFSRHNNVQAIQDQELVTTRNSAAPVLETLSATEEQPVIEANTSEVEEAGIEHEPVAENKPAADDISVAEKITAETMTQTDRQTDRQTDKHIKPEFAVATRPVATPVVSEEEAEKLNEEAIELALIEKEKKEPFFRFYENCKLETVSFEGTVRAISTIPDPEKNDYANCLYALFIELDSFFPEDELSNEIPCEAVLAVPIMKDKIINGNNVFNLGDKISCKCAEYDTMPQVIQEIQLSDNIQSFEHQLYYVLTIAKIQAFSQNGKRNFAKREITILPVQKLPKDEMASIARKSRIQNEINRIEEELRKHGNSFESWKEDYKSVENKYNTLCADDWKGWINDSYYYARGKEKTTYKTKEYIEGILPYKKYLEENNIDLILLRYPSRSDFAARVLGADDFQENPAWVEHYYECLKNDIEIVDPMPEMWEHRFDYPMFYFYNIPNESHPFEGEIMTAAETLSKVLSRYDIPKEDDPITLSKTTYNSSEVQFLWPEGNPKYNPEENLTFDQSMQNNCSVKTLQLNSSHPVIFLSNSFLGGTPFRGMGASVPAYLSFFLQTKPDWFYQSGIGNAMIRNLISSPELLANRRAVVMGAAFTMWDEAFPPFPKYISDNARSISLEKTSNFLSSDLSFSDASNDNPFVCSIDEKGAVRIIQNSEYEETRKTFDVNLSISPMPDRNTCMLRVNFGEDNNKIIIRVFDSKNGRELDSALWHSNNKRHTDLFVPVSEETMDISIQFKPIYPDRYFTIKNIELWYY